MRTAGDDVVREEAAILYAIQLRRGAEILSRTMMTSAVCDAGGGALEKEEKERR